MIQLNTNVGRKVLKIGSKKSIICEDEQKLFRQKESLVQQPVQWETDIEDLQKQLLKKLCIQDPQSEEMEIQNQQDVLIISIYKSLYTYFLTIYYELINFLQTNKVKKLEQCFSDKSFSQRLINFPLFPEADVSFGQADSPFWKYDYESKDDLKEENLSISIFQLEQQHDVTFNPLGNDYDSSQFCKKKQKKIASSTMKPLNKKIKKSRFKGRKCLNI